MKTKLNSSADYFRTQVEDLVLRCINDPELPKYICIEKIGCTICAFFFESSQSAKNAGFTGQNYNILGRWLSPYHTILHISKISD